MGKWYEVSKEDMEKIPQVIKKSLADPLEMGGSYLMLRQVRLLPERFPIPYSL